MQTDHNADIALKKTIRQTCLARRDALAPSWRADISARLGSADGPAIALDPGTVVAGFHPIRSELDIRPLLARLAGQGAQLCLPAIVDAHTILFRRWTPGAPLVEMALGTVGPGNQAETLDPDIILMPMSAFDRYGGRIGYGGGFYDRAIAALRTRRLSPRLIGVAFDCQQADRVPTEPHDVGLDEILTESGLRRLPY